VAKIKATAKLIENVRTIADNSRTHSIVLDLGKAKGGDDTGPTALELALMALADCATTICADVAKNSKITLTKAEAIAEAEKSPDSPRLTGVNLKVSVSGKTRKKLLEALWRRTEANCPVVYIFKESMPINVQLEVTPE
jgi:uncharacterized OsmC-like protein